MNDFCFRNASTRHCLFPVGAAPSPRMPLNSANTPSVANKPTAGEALRGEGAAPTGSNILVLTRVRYRAEPAFMLHDLT